MTTVISGTTGVSLVQDGTVTSAKIVDGTIAQVDLATAVVPLGVGQTWQTFTIGTQRLNNTPYTNSTGRPITISISAALYWVTLTIGAVTWTYSGYGGSGGANYTFDKVIPSGAIYTVNFGSATPIMWTELS